MKKIFLLLVVVVNLSFTQDFQKLKLRLAEINQPKNLTDLFAINDYELKKKSVPLAILYSFLMPGMGELYAGYYGTGKYFTIADVTLLITYIGMNHYRDLQINNFKAYAKLNGSVNVEGKDDEYFATISEYLNIEEYNNDKALNRDFNKIYNHSNYYWNWNSQTERKAYRSLWVSSQQANNNLRFVVGALLINRLASIINAIRLTATYNKKLKEESNLNFYFNYNNNLITDFSFNLVANF